MRLVGEGGRLHFFEVLSVRWGVRYGKDDDEGGGREEEAVDLERPWRCS